MIILPKSGEFRKIFQDVYFYSNKSDKNLEGVIFFQPKNGIDIQMITAKSGIIEKSGEHNVFNLYNGSFLKIESDKINILNFQSMKFNPFSEYEKKDEFDINRGSLPTKILLKKLLENKITPAQKTELFYRIFFPFSIIIFLLFAFPLSWRQTRSYKTIGILISIIVSLIFYITFSSINALSTKGIIDPFKSFLLATFLLISSGYCILYFKFRRSL